MQQQLFKLEPKKTRASAELAAWWFSQIKQIIDKKQNEKPND